MIKPKLKPKDILVQNTLMFLNMKNTATVTWVKGREFFFEDTLFVLFIKKTGEKMEEKRYMVLYAFHQNEEPAFVSSTLYYEKKKFNHNKFIQYIISVSRYKRAYTVLTKNQLGKQFSFNYVR
ncbi:MAG: hypothetical protein AAB438_03355 [Patescibacteria group bacterium]